jgi:NAD+ kinase
LDETNKMKKTLLKFKHVAVLAHQKLEDTFAEAQQVGAYLIEHGIQSTVSLINDEGLTTMLAAKEFDLVVTLGGDGTVLRAGHLCAPHNVPILPINFGAFGFLIEVQGHNWSQALDRVIRGDYWLEQRMLMRADHLRGEECLGSWEVVNDAVIGRGYMVRPVHLAAHLDGHTLATYVTDALIVATPTGSTAYAMAAGGPVLPPGLRNLLIVPVAPHLSIDRAIVLAEGSNISVEVRSDHEAILSIDGKTPVTLLEGDRINVRVSEHTLQFVRFQDANYFYRNLVSLMDQNPSAGARE